MNRPYIICHMVTSIDGKVTGDFLFSPRCDVATEIYYDINRNTKSNGFICGRVTMEGSFTGGWNPDLSQYEPKEKTLGMYPDCINDDLHGFYAIAFDPKGKLGWKSNTIIDEDPGYGGAQIIEVVTEQVDPRYLSYLEELAIPYIIAGENEIDAGLALRKLKTLMGIETLLLEGGSIVNGYFQRADLVDELSLVVAPVIAGGEDKPLFRDSEVSDFELTKAENIDDVVVLNYKRKG